MDLSCVRENSKKKLYITNTKKTGPQTGLFTFKNITATHSGIFTTLITFCKDLFCKRIK